MIPFTGFFLAKGITKILPEAESRSDEGITAMYPQEGEFINSTAAARVNGYLAGYGTAETF